MPTILHSTIANTSLVFRLGFASLPPIRTRPNGDSIAAKQTTTRISVVTLNNHPKFDNMAVLILPRAAVNEPPLVNEKIITAISTSTGIPNTQIRRFRFLIDYSAFFFVVFNRIKVAASPTTANAIIRIKIAR